MEFIELIIGLAEFKCTCVCREIYRVYGVSIICRAYGFICINKYIYICAYIYITFLIEFMSMLVRSVGFRGAAFRAGCKVGRRAARSRGPSSPVETFHRGWGP